MSDVMDYKLQHQLRGYISKLSIPQKAQLKNVVKCGEGMIRPNSAVAGVYLLTDNKGDSKFYGQSHCQNPWCCPVCSARRMEVYRSKIASALDMLSRDYFAFGMTFTIPHLAFMSCRETTDILYQTFSRFRTHHYKKAWHVFNEFLKEVPCDHHVRVCEYTWGKNGWHPHFHTIYWTKRGNEGKILEWQSRLNKFWLKLAKSVTLKYWQENLLHGETEPHEELLNRLFVHADEGDDYGLKISVKDGKLLECKSSNYICGWGSDRELTGNIRKEATAKGHYTPYQILEKAEHDAQFEKLYIDFCLAVTRKPVHHRFDFSQTGICSLIDEYRKTNETKSERIQKKTELECVAFFDEQQWRELCMFNRESPVLSNVLWFASELKYRALLFEYLEFLQFRREDIAPDRNKITTGQTTFIARALSMSA